MRWANVERVCLALIPVGALSMVALLMFLNVRVAGVVLFLLPVVVLQFARSEQLDDPGRRRRARIHASIALAVVVLALVIVSLPEDHWLITRFSGV